MTNKSRFYHDILDALFVTADGVTKMNSLSKFNQFMASRSIHNFALSTFIGAYTRKLESIRNSLISDEYIQDMNGSINDAKVIRRQLGMKKLTLENGELLAGIIEREYNGDNTGLFG